MLLPDMLEYLKNHRCGSPGYLGENYTNADGILVNDTCHEAWDKILDRMIFLWRETDEEKKLEQYRINCKDKVMDLMKEHFFALWD